MPHVVDVTCPACRARATFEFAETVRIRRKADVERFVKSALFDYQFVQDASSRSGSWHAAIYFHGLHRRSLPLQEHLPPGYVPEDWAHSRYWHRSHGGDLGALICRTCGLKRKHRLAWPSDAYYQAQVRGEVLWAFDRDSLLSLREYIEAAERKKARRGRWRCFLMRVPTHFLRAKVRDEALKQLDRLLGR